VVNAKTNFPDGTILIVSVGRVHYLKGRSSKYSGKMVHLLNEKELKNPIHLIL